MIAISCLSARLSEGEEPATPPAPPAVAAPAAQVPQEPLPGADLPAAGSPAAGPTSAIPPRSPETTQSAAGDPGPAPSFTPEEERLSSDWSAVTAPEAPEKPPVVPLRPAPDPEPELVPGGMSRHPEAGPPPPPILFPEMTPLERPGPQEDFMDAVHEKVSHGFLATATWLDSFFGDERYDVEDNRSRFRFRYIAFREDKTRMEYRPEVDFRLALPQLKKKTYIMITGDPNEDIMMSSSPAVPQGSPLTKPEDRNMTTALQYFFRSTERRSYSVMSGAKFHNGKPILFLGPRVRYLWHLDSWDLRFIEEVLWYTDTGWQSRTRLDLERPLGDLFFRTSWQGVWTADKNGYPYALAFTLLQPLDRNRAISYEWINSFQTRPADELDEVLFVFRYRQRILRDWLYLEIAPQERYPRDRSFHETPGIMFKLEMIIGDYRPFIF